MIPDIKLILILIALGLAAYWFVSSNHYDKDLDNDVLAAKAVMKATY